MVLLEDEEYCAIVTESERLRKEKLALEILARQKNEEAEAARVEIERLKLKTQRLEQNNNILMEHYALSRQKQFGISSEKTDVAQEQMLFNEAEACADINAPEPEVVVTAHTRIKKQRGNREIDFSLLPVEEKHYELSDEERSCPNCSAELHQIGEEITSKLRYEPGRFVHEKHIRPVWGCRPCDRNETSTPILTAKMPEQAFPKSLASASLVAYIMMRKYVEGLPLYRQEQQFRRAGIALSRQNLSNWVIAGSGWLEHIFKALHAKLREQDIAHADETDLQVLREPGRAAQTKSTMWLYASGRYNPAIRLYEYQRTDAREHALTFLTGFNGYLHVDGKVVYKNLPGVMPSGCWAHARRKFADIIKILPPEIQKRGGTPAHVGRKFCNDLFDIERDLKDATPEERHTTRQMRSRPVLDKYREWLSAMALETTKASKIGEAIRYSINQWDDLVRFMEDGRLEIDNNRAERAIKPFVLGRKAWMFANTPKGAKASAIIYSIVETAKENGLDPQAYLALLLERLPELCLSNGKPKDEDSVKELLPWTAIIQNTCKAKLNPTRQA